MTTLDPYDQNSWFFGQLTRNQANEILEFEKEPGVFLVRYSHSVAGDLVLSVSEKQKISHYIISKKDINGESKFIIGDNTFSNMPTLLSYYMHHYLDTTALTRAAKKKKLEYVRAKFDFFGNDIDDLPFRKNEILVIISKDEDKWWKARNDKGEIGSIPVPYVEVIDDEEYLNEKSKYPVEDKNGASEKQTLEMSSLETGSMVSSSLQQLLNVKTSSTLSSNKNSDAIKNDSNGKKSVSNLNRKLPAKAIVIQQRIPNAYDKKALKLEKGDILTVTNTNLNGQWEGELNGKKGHFPFNYIKFLDD